MDPNTVAVHPRSNPGKRLIRRSHATLGFTKEDKAIEVGDELVTICFFKTTKFATDGFGSSSDGVAASADLEDAWDRRDRIASRKELEHITVKGLGGKKCVVQFPVCDRPMRKYWIPQELHQSSVVALRNDVVRMKREVENQLRKLRFRGIAAIIAIIVTLAGILGQHYYWTSNTIHGFYEMLQRKTVEPHESAAGYSHPPQGFQQGEVIASPRPESSEQSETQALEEQGP